MNELPRRVLLQRVLQFTAGALIVPRVILTARAADSCVDPSSESLRSSLHYASTTPKTDEPCKRCAFFAADAARTACGNCQILSGPVDEKGHCDSWAAKG